MIFLPHFAPFLEFLEEVHVVREMQKKNSFQGKLLWLFMGLWQSGGKMVMGLFQKQAGQIMLL